MLHRFALAASLALIGSGARGQEAEPSSGPSPARGGASKTEFLAAVHGYLEAARYEPVEPELRWTTWVGASVELVRGPRATGYFAANVESVLGERVRSFEATQANYSLELGARIRASRGLVTPFFHHVSRHAQDRDKFEAIDWNFLGVKYERPWPPRFRRQGGFLVSGAVATLASAVEYAAEVRAAGEIGLRAASGSTPYLLADVRFVDAEASAAFPRDSLLDFRAEFGIKVRRETRALSLFVAYERRNDVYVERAGQRERALFGFRIRSGDDFRPSIVPLP